MMWQSVKTGHSLFFFILRPAAAGLRLPRSQTPVWECSKGRNPCFEFSFSQLAVPFAKQGFSGLVRSQTGVWERECNFFNN